MTNTEFEELDKAVNSLIGDKKKPADNATQSPAPAPTQATAPVSPPTPMPTPAESPKPAASPVPVRNTSAPARPSAPKGRFMDLRHPSSDMKPSNPSVPKRAPEPTQPQKTPTPQPQAPKPAPPKPVENSPQNPFTSTPKTEEAGQSPFLPDAAVQKRPLGGNSSNINSEPNTPPAPQDDPNSPLPKELQNDVMSIESGEVEDTAASSALTATHTPDKKAEETSAQPQTAAYHQPMNTKGGKKGPLTWIIWILLLVIIGAATGAAVYFWVLPLI